MKIIKSSRTDPQYNLALEEYLTYSNKYETPILFIWQNQNTIVVGRNQNTISEINYQAVVNDDVTVIRRNTGGGTVFQDLGNICYSLIIDKQNSETNKKVFEKVLNPIIELLKSMGLNAQFSGKNDIEIDGIKISGNAQLMTKDKILQHGTLLFDVELSRIAKYLIVNKTKIESKKIASVVSRVNNILELLPNKISLTNFMDMVEKSYSKNTEAEEIILDKEDIAAINKLVEDKYSNWEWTYGKNNTFNFKNEAYLKDIGLIQVNLKIDEGIITNVKIFGDFLGTGGTYKLEQKLLNERYEISNIKKIIEQENIKEIFSEDIKNTDLINIFFS